MPKINTKLNLLILLIAVFSFALVRDVFAQGSSSNFRIDESYIGPGGALESNSPNYSTAPGQQATGNDGGVGNSSSTNYQTNSGYVTTNDPSLTFSVGTGAINFGSLSTSTTSTATATFTVLNYTSYGYIVQIIGSPPTNSSYTLAAMSANGSSTTGTEQFGINLVDNSSPNIGADPAQVPDSSFSFGEAATNYNTANSFRYVAGETIATAPKTSGRTDYTISYIVNVSNTTAGGAYTGSQTLVCVGTY